MAAEVACRIISSGEGNYVSSRQERIGAFICDVAPAHASLLISCSSSTALIRRLKFRVQRSNPDRSTPQPAIVPASPSAHVGRSGPGATHSVPAQNPSEGSSRCCVSSLIPPPSNMWETLELLKVTQLQVLALLCEWHPLLPISCANLPSSTPIATVICYGV